MYYLSIEPVVKATGYGRKTQDHRINKKEKKMTNFTEILKEEINKIQR